MKPDSIASKVLTDHAVVQSKSLKPPHLKGSHRDFSKDDVAWIAAQFATGPQLSIEIFKDRGNINLDTFLVTCQDGQRFLLQRINTDIFRQPYRVMNAMIEWTEAQRRYLQEGLAPDWTVWEPVSLARTVDGEAFLDISDSTGWSVWRMMPMIADSATYKSLGDIDSLEGRLAIAEEVGRGLALSADLTSQVKLDDIVASLPGYRDTRGYLRQFQSVVAGNRDSEQCSDFLPADEELRESTEALYYAHIQPQQAEERRTDPEVLAMISIVESARGLATRLLEAAESGEIRRTAIHGDTKIENFLFCRQTGKVRSLVDLDTIMPFTWLADWGDMVRSLCNVAGEKEPDPTKIQVDQAVYRAVAKGFLSTTREATPAEIALMPEAVEIIAFELGTRFLTDYLRGDNYFALGPTDPPDLNKARALVQLTLFKRLREQNEWAHCLIAELAR